MRKVKRQIFSFSKGINTDAPATTFPADFAVDELNFEILQDGTRRRRKALLSIGGEGHLPDYEAEYAYKVFKWPLVNGNANINFVVIQIGNVLYFYNDVYPISTNFLDITVNLIDLKIDNTVTTAQLASNVISCCYGKGKLFICGKYIEPHYITYDEAAEELSVNKIEIKERDFEGFQDGIPDNYSPVSAEINDAFIYNLTNSGWTADNMQQFYSDTGTYPAKNLAYALAFRRHYDANYAEDDGVKEFSSDKLLGELFSDARAPIGHVIRNPFNTATVFVVDSGSTIFLATIESPYLTDVGFPGSPTTFVLNSTAHGLVTGDTIEIEDQPIARDVYGIGTYFYSTVGKSVRTLNVAGTYQVTVLDANRFTILVYHDLSSGGTANSNAYGFYVQAPYHYSETNGLGEVCPYRPRLCAWYAGRVWFAGVDYTKWAGKIYYSQIVETPAQHGKCYQQADPTSSDISDLTASDGGVFDIQEAGTIHAILPYSSKLLIFADNGVWELGAGSLGYFAPTSYTIRKISEVGVYGSGSATIADNVPIYWGKSSIYKIVTDPQQGFLVAQNISIGKVDNLFQSISNTAKQNAQVVYNDLRKQVLWCYRSDDYNSNYYDSILVYDLKYDAFTKWGFNSAQISAFTTFFTHRNIDSSLDENKVILLLLGRSSLGVTRSKFAKFARINSYVDEGVGGVEPGAYIITGYDALNSPDAKKQAPVITVYMNKTETGYTFDEDAVDSVWDTSIFNSTFWNWDIWSTYTGDSTPTRASSILMQARWDWADNSSAGKWGTAQQVYRHSRMYLPSGFDDTFDNGQPLVVTRNKVRGKGRSLHLKFTAGEGKDAWLVGWTTNYAVYED